LHNYTQKNTWREFQKTLQLKKKRKIFFLGFLKILMCITVISLVFIFLRETRNNLTSKPQQISITKNAEQIKSPEQIQIYGKNKPSQKNKLYEKIQPHIKIKTPEKKIEKNIISDSKKNLKPVPKMNIISNLESILKFKKNITKKELKSLVSSKNFINAVKNIFTINTDKEIFQIKTSLNIPLQNFLVRKLKYLKTLKRGKPQSIGLIAMEPETGRIIAMAGFNLSNPDINPCTLKKYPAASIFKIITASAAIEICGYNSKTPVYFNGNKYTLYKKQLKETKNKYTRRLSFGNAFAESINPVFGKIGSLYIGRKNLQKYSAAFGFNQNNDLDSDILFDSGFIKITDKSYQWAELGCGFNKTTTISPIFGAMIISTILNSGKMPVPCLVDKVENSQENLVYQRKKTIGQKTINPTTARILMKMMKKTIATGTARKSFRGFSKDSILSKLNLGGKTGSIYKKNNIIKYDWFTGFAREKKGKKQLAVSILVEHEKYIGTRASEYARMIFKNYFKNYFALKNKKEKKKQT